MKLDKGQQSEFNAVLMASLLRDVFRVFDRGERKYFRYEEFSKLIGDNKIDIDLELLNRLTRKNSTEAPDSGGTRAEGSVKNSETFGALIAKASSICMPDGKTSPDTSTASGSDERLQSIFSLIKTSTHECSNPIFYQLQPLTPTGIFPVTRDKINFTDFSYGSLITGFSHAARAVKVSGFNELFNGYWNLLKKYLWAVPINNSSGLSLFDFISLTSAVSASLYLYHNGNNSMSVDALQADADKFLLVGGDISGIQQFIFEIEQRNPKRLSKTLRGRSFFLSLLVEVVSLKILTEFNHPVSAKIMSSGGRFLILAPNTDSTRERLASLQLEIEEEFFGYFSGKVTFVLDYSTTLNTRDFLKAGIKRKISSVNININEAKLWKNFELIKQKPEQLNLVLSDTYEMLVKNKVCNFCGIFPAENIETEFDEEYRKCFICDLAEKIGHNIVSGNYLLFGSKDQPYLFEFLGIQVGFFDKHHESLLSYSLKEENINENGSLDFSISNFLPRNSDYIGTNNEDEEKLCHFCTRNDLFSQCKKEDRNAFRETHLSFQCIAAYSRFANKGKGTDKLAVFKADIDNLGYILQEGIPEDQYSLPHFTFLSRMLDLFFQDWLKSVIREYEIEGRKKYDKIYTVYSGGDDLLLIGPWYNIIEFAQFFWKKFQEFTGFNPDISFSAGIALFSPHSPVTIAVNQAEKNLEKSKSRKMKDSLTLFDTTIGWEQLDRLIKFGKFLSEKIPDDNSKIKVGFLHRLFKYRSMFMEAEEEGKIEGLRFHSLMNYDITRNIKQVSKKTEKGKATPIVVNQEEIDELLPLFVTGNDLDKELWRNLKIPLYIALYKNRGGKQNG